MQTLQQAEKSSETGNVDYESFRPAMARMHQRISMCVTKALQPMEHDKDFTDTLPSKLGPAVQLLYLPWLRHDTSNGNLSPAQARMVALAATQQQEHGGAAAREICRCCSRLRRTSRSAAVCSTPM